MLEGLVFEGEGVVKYQIEKAPLGSQPFPIEQHIHGILYPQNKRNIPSLNCFNKNSGYIDNKTCSHGRGYVIVLQFACAYAHVHFRLM